MKLFVAWLAQRRPMVRLAAALFGLEMVQRDH
jgi:hypothetical protein